MYFITVILLLLNLGKAYDVRDPLEFNRQNNPGGVISDYIETTGGGNKHRNENKVDPGTHISTTSEVSAIITSNLYGAHLILRSSTICVSGVDLLYNVESPWNRLHDHRQVKHHQTVAKHHQTAAKHHRTVAKHHQTVTKHQTVVKHHQIVISHYETMFNQGQAVARGLNILYNAANINVRTVSYKLRLLATVRLPA
ncbi:hypothetical protein QQS21_005141 [Conoideocrella luteorostrata]|uniref:Uncharacterized protein n=1 Tax=Conoideocrella luteorostrata TaxID=1105319 RepID=A0AAJ0CSS2_9HYPO|nr:hypothetical protein QQS21_005141 [Conoideocrella luteorostrata]